LERIKKEKIFKVENWQIKIKTIIF
jgi:hypothetical protein